MPADRSSTSARRRRRVPLSCDACRTRKLRCDRQIPCQNCSSRREDAFCVYRSTTSPRKPSDPMQHRLAHLESLVERLVNERRGIENSNHHDSHDIDSFQNQKPETIHVPTYGKRTSVIDGVQSVYRCNEDWHDILKEIKCLKDSWIDTPNSQPVHPAQDGLLTMSDGPSLLFGQTKGIDVVDILASIPPKPQVDKLLSQFFDRKSFPISVAPIVHEATFRREYVEHWDNPSSSSIIWIGLLFSILGITMLAYHQYGEPSGFEGISESLFQLYRKRTAQCLMMGDITKCSSWTLETLRLHATAELNRKDDNRRGLWVMSGVIVRAAISMGYHRDPSHFPTLSIFQAEFRRRVWLSIVGLDDMASFLMGFPRMLPSSLPDVMEPLNLHDWDLSEDMVALPPSRPLTEATSTSYLIIKGRLFRELSRITEFNNTPHQGSYETVLELDNLLHEQYMSLSSYMQIRGTENDSSALTSALRISKLQLESLYHQGVFALHRKFMSQDMPDSRYNISRARCISSALAVLDYQAFLEPSSYSFSQIRHILALAAMILILELEQRRKLPDPGEYTNSEVLLQALEKTYALWSGARTTCDESRKVSRILEVSLLKFQSARNTDSISSIESLGTFFESLGPNQSLDLGDEWLFSEPDLLDLFEKIDQN